MKQLGTWVNWEGSCDGFKAGAPETDVTGIAVAWQSTLPNLQRAVDMGCNLFITHEPTYYVHMDNQPEVFNHAYAADKKRFVERSGITIYRCHDVWDMVPEIGVRDSWAAGLGFPHAGAIQVSGYHTTHTFTGTAGLLARKVLQHTKELGQTHVQLLGDPEQPVHVVATGTGAVTDFHTMMRMGADAMIMTDDGMSYWSAGSQAVDAGIPLVVVNHAAAEEWGIRNLAKYIARTFPEVPVQHIPMGCLYQILS